MLILIFSPGTVSIIMIPSINMFRDEQLRSLVLKGLRVFIDFLFYFWLKGHVGLSYFPEEF